MSDPDPWAEACAEDLEAEKARRRARHGAEPGSPAEELRKLFEAVAEKVSGGLGNPLLAGQAAQTVQQLVNQAKSVVEPVIERNPQVFDHLAAAGGELLAAYRSAVEGHESRWTRGGATPADDPSDPRADAAPRRPADERPDRGDDEGPGTGQHIDLD
ncbi:DUF5304 domain-containing protein [Streptomyces sp. NPDC093249]|uniref:DUF5304 domain-containing protein n=1 Tax=unclassified Streptomyces TaxID=2593676 RepID=UPI003450CA36